MDVSGASGLSLLISAYSFPSSPDSSDQSSNEDNAESEPEDASQNGNDTTSQDSQDEGVVDTCDTTERNTFKSEYTAEDMFERYDSAIDTPPDSLKSGIIASQRHSIYSVKSSENHPLLTSENTNESSFHVASLPNNLKLSMNHEADCSANEDERGKENICLIKESLMDDIERNEIKESLEDMSDQNPSSLSQDEEDFMLSTKSMFTRTDSMGSMSSSLKDHLNQDDSMSSLSQDSDTWGMQRYDCTLSSSSTPLIKEEILEYTDGAGQYFYVPPDESQDIYKPEAPTYLHEQEFTSLSNDIKEGTIWNKDDSVFSSILHNVGLLHKDAATNISKLPSLQRSKLSVLLKSWSNQKAFTDCLVEMTDCDHFYDPIGYDTLLITDPCMSAKYDTLANGLNHREVERKQLDEFYNFTEEKSFFFQKCKICSKLFSNTFGLRQHIAHSHPNVSMDDLLKKDEGLFPCVKCKRTFNSQGQLKRHFQKTHIPRAPSSDMNFKCSHCGEHYKTSVLLHRHTSEKHRNRSKTEAAELHEPWSCEMCKSIFYKKSNFLKHMQKVHGKMKVSERLLNSAKLSAQLSAHLISPVGKQTREQSGSPKPSRSKDKDDVKEKRVQKAVKKLEFSDENSPDTQKVDSKNRSKAKEKTSEDESVDTPQTKETKPSEINATCLFCKLCFVSYTDLQLHCADVHRESNKIILLKMFTIVGSQPHGINFQCILCDKVSPTPPVALGHLESVHLNEESEVKVEIPVKVKPSEEEASYISPKLTDFDGLSLMCRFCNKTFKNSKIKRKHEKSVHNDQTIVCFYCFIPILNRTELTKHIKTEHSGSKSLFKCRWCDAHFTSIPKRCSHMKEFHSSDVANITNRSSMSKLSDCDTNDDVKNAGDHPRYCCDKCHLTFPSSELKSKHDRFVHNEVDFNCLYCFTSFKNKESLIQHIAVYHQSYHKRPYKCKWCEITFETLYQRSLHMKHSHDVLSIPNDSSPTQQVNNSDASLDENFLNVSNGKSLTFSEDSSRQTTSQFPKETSKLVRNCRFCDAEVTSMILKKHLIEHRQWDHFVCIFCDKTVPTIGGIKSHILRNHPFITTRKMDRSELGSGDIERVASIERMHNTESTTRRASVVGLTEPPPPRISPGVEIIFPCQVCFFLFSINRHVDDHWKEHSDAAKEEWTCTLCDEQYGEYKSFKFHTEMHRNDAFTFAQSTVELQNICGFCDITIETQQSLDGHVLIHRSVDHFNCIFCKCKSNTFRDMKAHISQNHMNADSLPNDPSRHLNETPFNSSTFKCSICLKLCNNQFNLNSHTKAHILGGKPCNLCNFKFKDMSALKNHLLLVHGAPEDYIAAIESKAASRGDAVADYCELCDTSFSSQGKFQKHRKACRDRFKSMNNQENNVLFSLLENGPVVRSRQSSEHQVSETNQDASVRDVPVCDVKHESYSSTDCENITQSSLDELESLPMEIPIKSTDDGSLCPQLSISPHSYNTRKRPRPDSYTNIVPAKMLNLSYLGYPRSNYLDTSTKKEPMSPTKTPLANVESIESGNPTIPPNVSPNISGTPHLVAKCPASVPSSVTPQSKASASDPSLTASDSSLTVFCDVCELNFSSHKQLYWHKHTKRHLAMELLSKGPAVVSHGKHLCDMCDQGYNCKKQLRWHKKIAHDGQNKLSEIVLRQLPQSRVGVPRSPCPVRSEFLPNAISNAKHTTQTDVSSESVAKDTVNDEPLDTDQNESDMILNASDLITDESEDAKSMNDESDSSQIVHNGQHDNEKDGQPGINHIKENKDVPDEFARNENAPPVNGDNSTLPFTPSPGCNYFCELCKLSYRSNKQLYNHKRTLSHIQLARMYDPSYTEVYYSCEECHIDFQSYKQLWNHKRSLQHKEIADKIFQNPPANSESSKGDPNGESEKSPELPRNFVCLDCECVFEDKKQMKWHKKTWNHKTITIVPPPNEKTEEEKIAPPREPRLPNKCNKGMICSTENLCRYHEVKEEKAPYNCQECNLPFRALRSYTVHCKQHLKEGFKCIVCNQKFQFKNYNNVKRHLTNIHKVAGDKTKNYMETFHNFDQNARPLAVVDPDDLIEGTDATDGEVDLSHEGGVDNVNTDDLDSSGSASPRSIRSSSPGFIEGLLDDVGLTLEICERKPEWIKSAKCKFCKVDFENVPEMLLHINQDHDKNYHKQFFSNFISPDDTVLDTSSDDDSDSDDSSELLSGPKDQSLSDIELDDDYSSADTNDELVTPSIRIKRPAGESLLNGFSKRPKIGFGVKSTVANSTEPLDLLPPSPTSDNFPVSPTSPDIISPEIPDEMFSESVHGPKRQYSCILCNTGFTVYLAWWYHSKTEHSFSNINYYGGSADSKMPGSSYESSSKKNVKAECPDCHAVFNQRLLLEAHLKSHRKPKIFQCDFCCKKFNSCKNASRHRLKCHCIVVNGRKCYLCKLCEKHFPRADDLIEHVQEQHDTASSTFCCATCGKVYNKESTFVSHIRGCDPESGAVQTKS